MGRIVVTEFVSLDGVMEAPGGGENFKHAGWTFNISRGAEGDKFKTFGTGVTTRTWDTVKKCAAAMTQEAPR